MTWTGPRLAAAALLAALAVGCSREADTRGSENAATVAAECANHTPSTSADGSKPKRTLESMGLVVFAASRPPQGRADLFVSRGDGSAPRRVTTDPRDEFTPSWSPDGSRIVFRVEALEEGTDADIWIVNADASGRRNLTATPRRAEWSPAWSPNGDRIAYFAANNQGGDIYVMNPDGSGKTNLTRAKIARANEYPTWSPDGEWIAYLSYGLEGNIEIYRMRADGSGQLNLTKDAAIDTWPSWSPDGSKIAFISTRDGNRELYAMNPDGTGVTRLTCTPKLTEDFPAWTADGRLAFYRARGDDLYPVELWVMEPDGSSPQRLQEGAFATTMSWIGATGE